MASDSDLKKFAAVVSPGAPVEGRLSVEVDAELAQGDRARSEKGTVRLDLKDGAVMGLQGLSAHVEGDVAEHRFSGIADVAWGTMAELHVKALGATLAGSALAASSWLGAAGQLQADAMVNLEQVRRAVPLGFGPISDIGGTARASLILSRAGRDEPSASRSADVLPPDLNMLVWTDGLKVSLSSETGFKPTPVFTSEGADFNLGCSSRGRRKKGSSPRGLSITTESLPR